MNSVQLELESCFGFVDETDIPIGPRKHTRDHGAQTLQCSLFFNFSLVFSITILSSWNNPSQMELFAELWQ